MQIVRNRARDHLRARARPVLSIDGMAIESPRDFKAAGVRAGAYGAE